MNYFNLIAFIVGMVLGLIITTSDWFFNLLEKIYNYFENKKIKKENKEIIWRCNDCIKAKCFTCPGYKICLHNHIYRI